MDQLLWLFFYGSILVAVFVFVQAFVRVGRTFEQIGRALEGISVSLRNRRD